MSSVIQHSGRPTLNVKHALVSLAAGIQSSVCFIYNGVLS